DSEMREVDLPKIDEDHAVVVVYTEDANGAAIQIACSEIEYAEIESGRITLRLSARMARIISSWRMCSARSSSIGSSGAAGWGRASSPPLSTSEGTPHWSPNASAPASRTTPNI